jgi:hypothetical protein
MAVVVKISPNDKGKPPGKLAFSIWERGGGGGRNVTFPARQYGVNGERRTFAPLRPMSNRKTASASSYCKRSTSTTNDGGRVQLVDGCPTHAATRRRPPLFNRSDRK